MHKGSNFSTSSPTLGTFVFVFLFIVTIPNGGKMVSHGFDLLFANGTPLQYSCLENPMDRGAWWAAIYGVTQSRTRLSTFIFTFHFHALEKEMATHSSGLAWRIPGTGEPGRLPSMGSHRVRHDSGNLAAAAAATVCWKAETLLCRQRSI